LATGAIIVRSTRLSGTAAWPIADDYGHHRFERRHRYELLPGSTEVCEIFNTTADIHPMHFHWGNVQLINRQPFQR